MVGRNPPRWVYVGYMPCGCAVAITSYCYEWREHIAEAVAEMIADGELVRLYSWEEYQELDLRLGCSHGDIVGEDAQQPEMPIETGRQP